MVKQMNSKTSLWVLSVLLMCATATVCHAAEPDQQTARPNILFILVDDLGYGDVGYLGSEIQTPNIDALAARGVVLDHGYVFPICSPTRAALMTGQNPLRFGIDGPMENDAMLPQELTLLPEFLRRGGYKTWMVGKWHLGMSRQAAMPQARGFDHFYGSLGGFIDYYTHVYFGGLDWQRNGTSLREEGYATDLQTRDALRLLTEYDGSKPFFLYLSYNSPHTPLQYPPSSEVDYSDIASADRRVFAQMTTDVDAAIGEVLALLEQRGLLANTLVIFSSDNGGNLEAGASNGSLRGGKGSAYEGGVRVPVVVAWPDGLPGGRSFSQPVFVQDWLPTLLQASTIDFDEEAFDGVGVWGALAADSVMTSVRPVVVGTQRSKAVFDWPWKLVRTLNSGDNPPSDELFNLATDPVEAVDLAADHPALVAKLGANLGGYSVAASKAAKGPSPESQFRNASGAFDYDIRKPETRSPWAEAAASN